MKKFNTPPIAPTICFFTGVAFGVICFFSLYFFSNGDMRKSSLLALGIVLLLWAFVFLLKQIKSARRNFQMNAILELLLLAVYITIAVASILPFAHYFTVLERRKEIKEKIGTDLDNVVKMFAAYEANSNTRIQRYESELTTAIDGKRWNYTNYFAAGFQSNGESDQNQKVRLMRIFKDDLLPAQYDTTKNYAIKSLEEDRAVVTDWILPMRFMHVIGYDEKEAKGWLAELKGYDSKTSRARLNPFDYPISFASVEQEITQRGTPSLIAVCIAIVLHLLLLFPYFFVFRNPRNGGLFFELFGNKKTMENGGVTL